MTNCTPISSASRETVLVIDDSPEVIALINELLKDNYRLKAANGGNEGLRLANADPRPDLILLDVMMPDLNGFEVCKHLKTNPKTREIPIVFLTSMNNEADEQAGFELGAADYIGKPISGPILRARVKTQLAMKHAADFVRDKNQFLVNEVGRRAREIEFVQDVTILVLASLAETRDNETGNHIRRTQHYIRILADQLQRHPRFSRLLTRANIEMIYKSAPLHDIGKVGIPDKILLKPGKLNREEFSVMKTHAFQGKLAIEHAEREIGRTAPFLEIAKQIALHHHEKWDGSGYPLGLTGDHIPIPARLMAVADVYDALISHRVYKRGMPHEQACSLILQSRGSHFDPAVADAFAARATDFAAIAARFKDHDYPLTLNESDDPR